eukprot:s29_g30.t1
MPAQHERVPSPAPSLSSSQQSVASSYQGHQSHQSASKSLFPSASEMSKSVKARMASGIWKRKSKKAVSLDSRKIPHQEPIEELFSSTPAMAPDPESPAAGGYRRILVPQKRRPASPAPAQLPGCVAGVVAPGALAFDWEAGGSPVQRRLRSSSPKTCEGLRGSLVLGQHSPRPYHNEEKTTFMFDSSPAMGGVRARSLRRSGLSAAARNLSPTWTMGENFPPEAAQESFPTKRRSLSPQSLMSQILNGEDGPPHRRLRGRAPAMRLSGRRAVETFVPVAVAQPLTMFKPSPALPERQSKEDAAIAMETARPIMWFGEDGQEERWSPFSWSPKPITRAGEFSPRRAGVEGSPSHRSHSPAGPKSPTVYGIEGLQLEAREAPGEDGSPNWRHVSRTAVAWLMGSTASQQSF